MLTFTSISKRRVRKQHLYIQLYMFTQVFICTPSALDTVYAKRLVAQNKTKMRCLGIRMALKPAADVTVDKFVAYNIYTV